MAENITIQFKATGGTALKKTIETIYAANVRLTKGQKEYDKVVKKLNSTNKQLLNSQKKIKASAERLARAQKKLAKQSNKTSGGLLGMGHAARNTAGAFSVLRSKLLLVSFGMALVINPMLKLAKVAGDMQEIVNKANVVFGSNMGIVTRWARALGSSVGRASSTLLEMASSLQDTFVPLGFTREAATRLSTSLTELALDVGSFSNKLDADVLRDFQSAIVGNHETVRKYGIIIDEALLKQEAYNMGIGDGVGELTASEKVQARVSLITKGSSDAIGDLSRTQESYVNTLKRFNNFWKETAELVGELLQPLIQTAAAFLSNERHVKAFAFGLGLVATHFVVIRGAAILAALSIGTFTKAVVRTGIGALVVGLGYLIESFMRTEEVVDDTSEVLDKIKKEMEEFAIEMTKATTAQEEQKLSVEDSIDALIRQLIALGDSSAAAEYSRKIRRSLTDEEIRYIKWIEKEKKALKDIISVRNLINRTLETQESLKEEEISLVDDHIKLLKKQAQAMLTLHGHDDKFLEHVLKLKKEMGDGFSMVLGDSEDVEFFTKLIDEILRSAEASEKLKAELQEILNPTKKPKKGKEPEILTFDGDPIMNALAEIGMATGALDLNIAEMGMNFVNNLKLMEENGVVTATNVKEAFAIMATEIASAFVSAQMEASAARIQSLQESAQADITAFKQTERYNKLSEKQKKSFEDEKLKETNKAIIKEFENNQKSQRAGVVLNTAAAIMNAMANIPAPYNIPMAAIAGVMGALQLETINSQSAPTMALGGLIGGKLHSQGGTMINAERGEYVMSRDAVDAVGVETMNRINQGGGSAINVSFTGNVMSDEFLESEAIPKIKEAIRRGADIGVS